MSEATNYEREQLLMAYLDGELGDKERTQVESLIAANPDYANQIAQWQQQGDLIRSMPKFRLDDGFANRVMASVDAQKSAAAPVDSVPSVEPAKPRQAFDSGANWRSGAGAIATLAAMLLLTLFVFPKNVDPPTPTADASPGELIEDTNHPIVDGVGSDTNADPSPEMGTDYRDGPSRPALAKSMEGHSSGRAPRELVTPYDVAAPADSLEQVLWVDMKSHSTALADIEAVLLKNSLRILRDGADPEKQSAAQNHLTQRSNSRFEALHVVATRGQVKKAIIELSQQHQAKVQAITLPARAGFYLPANGSSQMTEPGKSGPDGKTPHLKRIKGSEKTTRGSATVQQLSPHDLISPGANSDPAVESDQVDPNELRQLEEWFGLAESEDESRVVRLLLLIDTSAE